MATRSDKLAPPLSVPRHVAVIMDGNGRWAAHRGLARIEGHRAGAETVRRMLEICQDLGIEYLTLYAFSTENWRRPKAEIAGLFRLLRDFLTHHIADLEKNEIRLNAIGQLSRLPLPVQKILGEMMDRTRHNRRGVLTLALSYGARDEIVHAARRLAEDAVAGRIRPDQIDEALLAGKLFTAGMPDPDLVIRTSGEMRLSNFLLWQASYAEFYVTPTLWPDFSKEEFCRAVEAFSERHRRFGGVSHV